MKAIAKQMIDLALNQEQEQALENLRYQHLESPASPSDNLMKTKLNNLFSNLSYFEQEGKKIIRRSVEKIPKNWFGNNLKQSNIKHSFAVSKTKLKPENKIKDEPLPILHLSQMKLDRPSNSLMFFESREFFPNKSLSKNQIQPQLSQFNQYERLIKILKHHDKPEFVQSRDDLVVKQERRREKDGFSRKKSKDGEFMRSTSMFFRTKKTRHDNPRLEKLRRGKLLI